MGEEANKHGYEIKAGTARLTTRTLAIFHRKKGEISQSFYITEDLLHKGVIYLDCKSRISAKYEDDESFESCIKEFNSYLLDSGYRSLNEELDTPVFLKADSDYVRDNYEELAKVFFESKQIQYKDTGIKEALGLIIDSIKECLAEDWVTVKDELLVLAGALTFLLVNSEYPIYIREKKNMPSFYLEREEGVISLISNSPLDLIYATYKSKSVDKIMIHILRRYFTKDELSDVGL